MPYFIAHADVYAKNPLYAMNPRYLLRVYAQNPFYAKNLCNPLNSFPLISSFIIDNLHDACAVHIYCGLRVSEVVHLLK